MRISKSAIRARHRDLPISFSRERISAHGGLEIVRRFFELIDLRTRVRDRMRGVVPDGDYGFTRMLLALVGLLIVGGARVTRLAFLGNDPVFLRFCGLHRLPADRTVVAWLKAFRLSATVPSGDTPATQIILGSGLGPPLTAS